MSFEPKKFNQVFEDMRQRTSAVSDFGVGSVTRTLYESFAYELALLYEKMNLVYLSAFVDTASGPQLDQVVAILGIRRGLPDFAEGNVSFERDVGNADIVIPLGTLVATEELPETVKKVYQTIEAKTLLKDQQVIEVKVQAVERGEEQATLAESIVVMPRPVPGIKSVLNRDEIRFVGKRRETDDELRQRAKNTLISSGKATIISIENALLSMDKVEDVKVNEKDYFDQGTYGAVEVFVDGPDLEDPKEKSKIEQEIDRVRAAGVFVLLKPVVKIHVDGVFRIEINPALNLSSEEIAEFESNVKDLIIGQFQQLKMGQPFLFSKLIKETLSLDGIENLVDFQVVTQDDSLSNPPSPPLTFGDKQIEVEEFERFNPRYICVASEEKQLLVHMNFQAPGITGPLLETVKGSLQTFFSDIGTGAPVSKNALETHIETALGTVNLTPDSLVITPESWCDRPLISEEAGDQLVMTSFVENPVCGEVFAYAHFLDITGSFILTLPDSLSAAEKQTIREAIEQEFEAYVAGLKAEEDVLLEELINRASTVTNVLGVSIEEDDFRVSIEGIDQPTRLNNGVIDVAPFEKAMFKDLCISGNIETVTITLEALVIHFNDPAVDTTVIDEVKAGMAQTITQFLDNNSPGDDFLYANLKVALENMIPELSYELTSFSMKALAQCGGREQISTLVSERDFHIRSNELASIQTVSSADISHTVATS